MLLACAAFVAEEIEDERELALTHAQVRASNIARILDGHLHQTIRRIDQALIHFRQEYHDDPKWFGVKTQNWQKTAYTDLAFQIAIIDANGMLHYSSMARSTTPVDLSDREHFRIHKERLSDELFISAPVLGRVTQKWSIQFTRPLLTPSDEFEGVIVLSLDVDQLSNFYRSVDVGTEGSVSLIGVDRIIRARGTNVSSEHLGIGYKVPPLPYLQPGAPPSGLLNFTSSIDNIKRLGAYSRLSAYPLNVVVLYSENEILRNFQDHEKETIYAAVSVGLVIVSSFSVILFFMRRQVRNQQQLEIAHQELARTEERWRLALEAVGDGVWDWNVGSGEVYFSARWRAKLGYEDAERSDSIDAWTARVHPDDLPALKGDTARLLRGENRFHFSEYRLLRADGSYRWVLERGVIVSRDQDGRALRAVGTHTDITRRKGMEESLNEKTDALIKSNKELEAFAYAASHDLRQPLRTVNSYAALLQRELGQDISDDAKEFIGFIVSGAKRMDRLIVDLLEYSRVGRKEDSFAPVAMTEICRNALANLDAAVRESAADIVIAPDLPTVFGNELELTRLLQNLIGNAIKYRDPHRPIKICVEYEKAKDGQARFSVRDSGIGIDSAHSERVFGIFQRLKTTEATEGTGIGLALCKKIVEHHGGRIWLTSVPGEGSVFYFTLPVA